MITIEKLNEVAREMQRMAKVMRDAKKRLEDGGFTLALGGCKETSAVHRASMDLTRALTKLRRAGR